MSNLNIERDHNLGLEKTRALIDKWLPNAEKDLGMTYQLDRQDDRDIVTLKRSGFEGELLATANRLELNGKVGMLLRGFLPKIKSSIEGTLDKLIDS